MVDVDELVETVRETQRRTEDRLDEVNQILGGLLEAVEYQLEDEAMLSLPLILQRDFGIIVEGRLVRRFFRYPNGRTDEVNIFGEGRRGEQPISIVGQAKSQLAKKHLDDLMKQVARLQENGFLREECILVVVTYSVDLEVEEYAKDLGVKIYWSFELIGQK